MKLGFWFVAAALPLGAHMVSMSSGTLKIEGTRLVYQARIPLFEIPNMAGFDKLLFSEIRFSSKHGPARMVSSGCVPDPGEGFYRCDAVYELAQPEEEIEAAIGWHKAIAQNHVHVLSAMRGELMARAVFQASTPEAALRFRPLTLVEKIAESGAASVQWFLATPVMWLLCLGLVVVSRNRPELLLVAAAFFIGQLLPMAVIGLAGRFNPRFLELGAALAVAYLAVEVLFLPEARNRWLVAGCVGFFPGLALGSLVQQTDLDPIGVWVGAIFVELFLVALGGAVWLRWGLGRVERPGAWGLLGASIAWFGYRWLQ